MRTAGLPKEPLGRAWRAAAEPGRACLTLRAFRGCPPKTLLAGRDGARAFDFLSQALDAAEAALAHGDGSPALPPLAPASPDTATEGDLPPLLSAADARFSALTWLGRRASGGLAWWCGGSVAAKKHRRLLPTNRRCRCPRPARCRCYMEGAGVERSIAAAADHFARAGNEAELQQLAAMQREFAAVQLPGGGGGGGD